MTNEEIIDLAHETALELQGTCRSIEELGDERILELFNTSSVFTGELDQLVFECTQCCWWCEISEMSQKTEYVCDDCEPNDDEED